MKTISWDMAEQFTFPVGLGAIEEVVSVKVTPQWEQSDDGQSIRLSGIYHIVASVQFNPVQQVEQVDGTYIEHIDLEHSTGYFEYALPLEVDLPSNKVEGPIKLEVSDIKALNDTASCQFVWQVQCDFADPETALVEDVVSQKYVQSQVAEQTKLEQEQVVKHETVEHKPEQEQVAKRETEHKLEQEQVAKLETVERKPEQEQVAKRETEHKLEQEQVAKLETVEHKPNQEHVAHHETVERGELKERLEQQEIAEHKVVQEEVAQHEIAEQKPKKPTKSHVAKLKMAQLENVQQEPVTTQESSFKQPAAQRSPLQEDFFVELSDSYSVYNAKLNKIRS